MGQSVLGESEPTTKGREIVGVAGDAVLASVFEGPSAAFYIAAAQMEGRA